MTLFFELIQVALGRKASLSHTPSAEQWQELYLLSKKQALLGINYAAIERLPKEQRPPRKLLLQWCLAAERIKERNTELNNKIPEISRRFANDGFPNLILKGQGVAQYYAVSNLEQYRTPGDADIWLKGDRKDIIAYVRKYSPSCHAVYHHVDFPETDNVHIELHFTPSWMNSYFTNRRLQRFFAASREIDSASGDIPVPSVKFNRVYILLHTYRHLFHEGVGLRQILDYYFVLLQGFTAEERTETMTIIKSLGMKRFTAAVMWILSEVLGIKECYLLTAPNEKYGRFLLEEIMLAGNLGQHDRRISHRDNESDLVRGMRKVKRNFRFLFSYPSEVLWSPWFKLWHYFWRRRANS